MIAIQQAEKKTEPIIHKFKKIMLAHSKKLGFAEVKKNLKKLTTNINIRSQKELS